MAIVSHCGETYSEHVLIPDRRKPTANLLQSLAGHGMPATLEGCVVRIADKIAYIAGTSRRRMGRDHGVRGHFRRDPTALGRTNGQIINTLDTDIIEHSHGQDAINHERRTRYAEEQLLGTMSTVLPVREDSPVRNGH
jgi:dGTPase